MSCTLLFLPWNIISSMQWRLGSGVISAENLLITLKTSGIRGQHLTNGRFTVAHLVLPLPTIPWSLLMPCLRELTHTIPVIQWPLCMTSFMIGFLLTFPGNDYTPVRFFIWNANQTEKVLSEHQETYHSPRVVLLHDLWIRTVMLHTTLMQLNPHAHVSTTTKRVTASMYCLPSIDSIWKVT